MDVNRDATVIDMAKRHREGKIPKCRTEDFLALVSINADAMIVLDHEGYVLYANPATESLFSLPSAEMIGAFFGFPIILKKPVELYILREFKDFVAAEMRMVEAKWAGEPSYLLSFRDLTDRIKAEQAMSQSREELDVKVNVRTRELSEINESLKREITERKRAEEALKLTQTSIDGAAEMVAWFTPDGKVYYVNDATCRTLGYSRDELLKMTVLDISPGFTWEQFGQHCQEVRERKSFTIEIPHRRKDGSEYPAEIQMNYVQYGGQEFLFAYGKDITGRKKAEEALKEAKAQAELYLDLMGHDINNMHQIALGYLELARELQAHEAGQAEFLDKPIEVLQRSARLIQNVRKLQKLNEGAFQSKDVDVCQMLVDVHREFGAVPHKAITLDMGGCERCHVRANELLRDVFSNLVSNAIKHTGDKADINIGLDVVDDNGDRYCRVSVEDNGPGVPDDFKRVIFNRVLKGTNKAKGMGLGLYLVKSLMDGYGGRVWVEDRVSGDHTKGARFVVMLPAIVQ